ncbi:MAG: hypothetical protein ACJ8AX_14730, partial [Gemmatimonadales bacterium]
HFLIGPAERLARLRAFLGELPTLRSIGVGKERDLRPLRWQWFDWRDPNRPSLSAAAGNA